MRGQPQVYGPYARKIDGRRFVVLIYQDQSRRSLMYGKYLLQQHLNRELSSEETVDHINGDPLDDRVENLRILDRATHAREDHIRVMDVEITCVRCGRKSSKKAINLDGNANKGRAGPFCSRSCAGSYSTSVQYGKGPPLCPQPKVPKESRTYYKVKKET